MLILVLMETDIVMVILMLAFTFMLQLVLVTKCIIGFVKDNDADDDDQKKWGEIQRYFVSQAMQCRQQPEAPGWRKDNAPYITTGEYMAHNPYVGGPTTGCHYGRQTVALASHSTHMLTKNTPPYIYNLL